MSDDPRRLVERGDAVAHVLRSGLMDEPSESSISRSARALGLGSAVATVVAAKAAQASVAVAQPVATHGIVTLALKWLAAGVVTGALATSSLSLLISSPPHSTEPTRNPVTSISRVPVPTGTSIHQAPPARPSAVPGPSTTRGAGASPLSVAPHRSDAARATKAIARRSSPSGKSAASTSAGSVEAPTSSTLKGTPPARRTLDLEITLLDGARNALQVGKAEEALARLARFDREIPEPTLAAEATLLRVQALVAAGRGEEARRIAERALNLQAPGGYGCRLAKIVALNVTGCGSGHAVD